VRMEAPLPRLMVPAALAFVPEVYMDGTCTRDRYPAQPTPLLLSSQRTLSLVIAEDDVLLLSDCLSCPVRMTGRRRVSMDANVYLPPSVRALLPRP
jgi:hypothetical protein